MRATKKGSPMSIRLVFLLLVLTGCGHDGCDPDGTAQRNRETRETWEGECADTTWLLATTTGSPSTATCPNRRQKMRVELASAPSHEEFGAVVFCECQRPQTDAGAEQ